MKLKTYVCESVRIPVIVLSILAAPGWDWTELDDALAVMSTLVRPAPAPKTWLRPSYRGHARERCDVKAWRAAGGA